MCFTGFKVKDEERGGPDGHTGRVHDRSLPLLGWGIEEGVTAVLGSQALVPGTCCHVYRTLNTALGSQALVPGPAWHRTLNTALGSQALMPGPAWHRTLNAHCIPLKLVTLP